MAGQFVGNYARDSFEWLLRHHHPTTLLIDLSEVTVVDRVGEDVLSCFGRLGVRFVGDSAYALAICERLHLPLANEPASHVPRAM